MSTTPATSEYKPKPLAGRPRLFYGWVVAVVAAFSVAIVYGFRISFAVFFVPIIDEFGWDRAVTSSIISTNVFVYGLVVALAGTLVDRFGPRIMIPAGVAVVSTAVTLCSQASELWHFYLLLGVIAPLGMAMSGYIPNFVMLTNWFVRRRATALGIALSGNGGAFLLTSVATALIVAFGWRAAYAVLGIVFGGGLLLATALLDRRHPRDMGLLPDGDAEESPGETVVRHRTLEIVDQAWVDRTWTARSALGTWRFWCFFFANMLIWGFGFSMLAVHHAAYAEDAGHSAAAIAAMVGTYGVVNIGGNLCAFLADRWGREPVYALGTVSVFLGLIALLLAGDPSRGWLLVVYGALLGFGYGICSPTASAAVADVFQGRSLGVINGLVVTSFGIGGSFSPWLAGYIFDRTGSYVPAFMFALVSVAFSCVLLWLARPSAVRRVRRNTALVAGL